MEQILYFKILFYLIEKKNAKIFIFVFVFFFFKPSDLCYSSHFNNQIENKAYPVYF